jgi:hypothetical protein
MDNEFEELAYFSLELLLGHSVFDYGQKRQRGKEGSSRHSWWYWQQVCDFLLQGHPKLAFSISYEGPNRVFRLLASDITVH